MRTCELWWCAADDRCHPQGVIAMKLGEAVRAECRWHGHLDG